MQVEHPPRGDAHALAFLASSSRMLLAVLTVAGQDAQQRRLERLARRRPGLPEAAELGAFRQAEQVDQGGIGLGQPEVMPDQAKADGCGGIERLQGDVLLLGAKRRSAAPVRAPAPGAARPPRRPCAGGCIGFCRKSKAPTRIARIASSSDPWPVINTTSTPWLDGRAANDLLGQRDAAQAGHPDIGEDHGDVGRDRQLGERILGTARRPQQEAAVFEAGRKLLAQRRLVLDKQDAGGPPCGRYTTASAWDGAYSLREGPRKPDLN